MNATIVYPLGHNANELGRLDIQAMLLHDPLLEELVKNAKTCLEIGCGNGSNLALLRSINPSLKYTGIDSASEAISAADYRFESDGSSQFLVMDGANLDFADCSFDLVFTKLVLWSVGDAWTQILSEANRVLSAGGSFYALEPSNELIELFPEKPAAKEWMQAWDLAAKKHGHDTSIGKSVAAGLRNAGFKDVDSKFFPVIASGAELERYNLIVGNLKGFYMGPAADLYGLSSFDSLKKKAAEEFEFISQDSLVMDALYVSWAKKAS